MLHPLRPACLCVVTTQIHVQAVKSGGKFVDSFFRVLSFWGKVYRRRQQAFVDLVRAVGGGGGWLVCQGLGGDELNRKGRAAS